jgi:hypothetical protein
MGKRHLVGDGGCPSHPRWTNDAPVAVKFALIPQR